MKRLANHSCVVFAVVVLLDASAIFAAETECFSELVPNRGTAGNRPMLSDLKLDGMAKGGELVLLDMLNPNPRYIRIDTNSGETAEVVLARLAAAINEFHPFKPDHARIQHRNERGETVRGPRPKRAEGKLLKSFGGYPGGYIFTGTETGLGIPPPPTSLSVSYDSERHEFSLAWENPDEPYDAIGGSVGSHAGTTTNLVKRSLPPQRRTQLREWEQEGERREKVLRRFIVIGCSGGVLSNAATITWDYDDPGQQELDTQPFTGGICPNWKRWSHGDEPEKLVLEQGNKGEWKQFNQKPKRVLKPDDKPYYQSIKTRSADVIGGVYRKFLGLQPGHTYRLNTRMNTFEMDNAQGNWSFSFHAAPHAKAVTLSAEQMAGTAPLPDGNGGTPAALIASFGPGATTQGKFLERSTDKPGPESQVLDITMPAGAEVITVWFRCTGLIPSGVGFDWIKLKDITTQ